MPTNGSIGPTVTPLPPDFNLLGGNCIGQAPADHAQDDLIVQMENRGPWRVDAFPTRMYERVSGLYTGLTKEPRAGRMTRVEKVYP